MHVFVHIALRLFFFEVAGNVTKLTEFAPLL